MDNPCEEFRWAQQEFGSASLGDPRRVKRLVLLAAQAARHPAGQIPAVLQQADQRHGAYRLLENPHISSHALGSAAHSACAQRARGLPFVWAPTDGSSFLLSDPAQLKGFGSIGTREKGACGLKVLSVQALSPKGVPLGLLAQQYWARGERSPRRKGHHDGRRTQDKETQHWLDAMHNASEHLAQQAPQTRLWFQLDREGDAWAIFGFLLSRRCWFTIRAAHDRRLVTSSPTAPRYLMKAVQQGRVQGGYTLQVPAGPGRTARQAQMVVRAAQVVLDLRDKRTDRSHPTPLRAVFTREVGTTPPGEKPLSWLLLTNVEVKTLRQALQVIQGYTQRWRIEQFHRLWKSEACRVEDSQLRSREAMCKWATVLASVAMRIERMMYLGRNKPELSAEVEFSRAEIDAVILLREPKGVSCGAQPRVGEVVRWIADLGGYTGKSSGGPPGAKVLSRGLLRIVDLAAALSSGKVVANA